MIYLASPYTHPDPVVRERRVMLACSATVTLMRRDMIVFSPIVHGHPLLDFGLPIDWSYWERFDRAFLVRCSELAVLMLDGWDRSDGVASEIKIAKEIEKPVRYLSLPNLDFAESATNDIVVGGKSNGQARTM